MHPAGPGPGEPLPGQAATDAGAGTRPTGSSERPHRRRAGAGAGGADQRPVRRQVRRADLGDAAGRGHLPVLDVEHAPDPASQPRCGRTPLPGHPPVPGDPGAAGHQARAGLVLGHHQAARTPARGLLRPVRRARHLLPLRRGLDRRRPGGLHAGHRAARAGDGCARCARGGPRRPGHLDDLQTRRAAAGRPGRDPLPLPALTSATTTRTASRSSRR